MGQSDITTVAPQRKKDKGRGDSPAGPGDGGPRKPRSGGPGPFAQYKPEQGKWTRWGTFIGACAVVVWGALFIRSRLTGYEDITAGWGLLVTPGIPIAFAVVMGAVCWWLSFGHRAAGDFFIATEGEMKKVSWSTRREIIGSTKVVILFTVLLAVFLFMVDLVFVGFFRWIGVLKTGI